MHTCTHRQEERRRRSPPAGEWRLISGEKQLFRIPVDQISSKHRTRSERRLPSGTRSDHRSPPRRRDDHWQPSVRSESKRGRSSPPSPRHGNSPTRQSQSKRSRYHRGHGPRHTSELSSRLSDRQEIHEPRRGDYTALKLSHNSVEAHQEQSERPCRMPRSATITHPWDEKPTARLVEVSSGGSMKIHVDPVHPIDADVNLCIIPNITRCSTVVVTWMCLMQAAITANFLLKLGYTEASIRQRLSPVPSQNKATRLI